MKRNDVSVVLNMHREALFLRPTLLSLEACAGEAAKAGIAAGAMHSAHQVRGRV